MKAIFSSAILLLLLPISGFSQQAAPSLAQAKALADAGNFREAADAAKAILNPKSGRPMREKAETVGIAISWFARVGAQQEAQRVIEQVARDYADEWLVLLGAAEAVESLQHQGMIIDGEFERGASRNGGRWVQATVRDRVWQMQLIDRARQTFPADAPDADRARLWEIVARALAQGTHYHYYGRNASAWRLQALTRLDELPGYDDETGLDDGATGYPVDEQGDPVYFGLTKSWEEAKSDGERLRWALAQCEKVPGRPHYEALQAWAQYVQQWLGVHTLADYGFVPPADEDTEGQRLNGIAALHTLKDEETVARLATGPKRFALPAEGAFLARYRDIAADENAPRDIRRESWSAVAAELSNRRQFPRAAEALEQALTLADSQGEKDGLKEQIDQIRGNLGMFESQPPQPAGKEAKLGLIFRNARHVSLTARKVDVAKYLADVEGYLRSRPNQMEWQRMQVQNIGQRLITEGGEKYLGPVVAKWEKDLEPRPNHWDKRVDLETPLQEAGAWWVEATFEGGRIARTLVWLEGMVIVETKQANRAQFFVADAVTGAPVAGAAVKFFGWRQEWKDTGIFRQKPGYSYSFKDAQSVTDEHGQAFLAEAKASEYQWLITANATDGRLAFLGFERLWLEGNQSQFGEETRLYLITDRPVYRPAQEVKWKAWARAVGYGLKLDTNRFRGSSMRVTIHDPRGEKVLEKTYKADDSGAIDDALTLGADATLGLYQVAVVARNPLFGERHLGNGSFRVEEYKKPEFEVKVEAPETPVSLGDSFEVKVRADYYFGGPVKVGKVKYKIQRSPRTDCWYPRGPWDWLFGEGYAWRYSVYDWYPGSEKWCRCLPPWPWWPRQSNPPELVASGEAPLNADGTYTVKIDTALAKELHGDQDHKYQIDAEVTDASRRTINGSGTVLAARRPFEVYVWLDRGYYQAGETGEIRMTARTLDGRAVAAKGNLKLLRVTYDKNGKPSEEAVGTFDIKTNDEEARQKVTWARTGQYRVSCHLTDAAGHEVEGVAFTTVRGEGFAEGRDFHFDDLELVTQKDEYAPGEEVEVTVNTNRSGSTVALFLRPENGVYPEPVWLALDGKSTTYRFKLEDEDQPNIFIEACTLSDAKVHQVTRQIIVPPKKRIATVELVSDKRDYLPRENPSVRVRVRDQEGKPFTGRVVLTAYDKALEYISGGSNIQDIRPFFWGWKRSHQPQAEDSLRGSEVGMMKDGEVPMSMLGLFGNTLADASLALSNGDRMRGIVALGGRMAGRQAMFDSFSAGAPAAAAPALPAMEEAKAKNATSSLMAMTAAGEAPPEGQPPMIRSNLADSAVWIADLITDENGEGAVNFAMPDNLTTWKLRSWVMGPQTQVGEAAVEIVTRKNLMVRLQAPRFFVEKDEVVLSANVHNEMDEAQDVKAVLELEGGVVELMKDIVSSQSARIEGHAERRFDWRVRVTGEGEAKVRVKALAQKDSDAMEMTFPAYVHGILKTDSWSLALRPNEKDGKIAFAVPAERKPGQSRLEVRYSPTLAMAMVDALPYLAGYPYGCTEQTLNRFVPTVITLNVLKELGVDLADVRRKRSNLNAQEVGDPKKRAEQRWQGRDEKGNKRQPVFDEDEVKKMAKAGLDRLVAMRGGDGGWGWFPGGRESSEHITAVVLHGLHAAERAGLDVNDGIIRSGVQFLRNYENEQLRRLRLPKEDRDYKPTPDNLDALVHSVLVEYKSGDAAMRTFLFDKRNVLSRYNVALLGVACHALGERERRDMCLRNLRQFLKQDEENQTAWLQLPEGGWWWYWYDNDIETQAAYLRLLCAAEPKSELAPRLAKYLMNNRRNGTYWNSTKDTAAVIEALADFIKASGESKPDLTLDVTMDGKVLKTVKITPENLFTFDGTVLVQGEDVETGKHTLEFHKEGASPLYANAYLTVFSQEDMIPAAGLEVKVRRKFYRLIEEKPEQEVAGSRGQVVTQTGLKYRREELISDAAIKSGDTIEVELTVESKNDYEYVLIEDRKPAGFEPIEVQSGWNWEGLAAYKEYHDERVAFFAERLPHGTHNLSYRVKAEIPGRFSALPTRVEAMYAPELKANSNEWKALIED